jgi:lipopolysaccharide transport system permease protein
MSNKDKFEDETIIISSESNTFLNFNEIFKYRDLIYLLVSRDFKVFYKQTILGPFWYILQPLLNSAVFTVIFGKIASMPTDEIPPFIFYMSGTILWSYFSTSMISVSNVFSSNKDLFSKVYFPRLVVPISNVIINYLQFFIQFIILVLFIIYFYFNGSAFTLDLKVFLIPLLLIQLSMISIGFGCLFASITYKYKDLALLLGFGMQLWMFVSPVIYPMSMISDKYIYFYILNPVSSIIENFRYILFSNSDFNLALTVLSLFFSIVIFIFGLYIFNKVEKNFMDTI